MKTVTIQEAKPNLSQLMADVEAGEQVLIARGKEPAVHLVSARVPTAKREFGALAGKM